MTRRALSLYFQDDYEIDDRKKLELSFYMLFKILPYLKQIQEQQEQELAVERKLQGNLSRRLIPILLCGREDVSYI